MIEEIDDFINENPVNSKTPLSTFESNIKRAEDIRFSIRLRNRKEVYDSINNSYVTVMNNMKSYIKQSKQAISDSQTKEKVKQTVIHRQSISFEISDVNTKLKFIEQKMIQNVKDLSDEEIAKLKTDVSTSDKVLENVSERTAKLIANSNFTDTEHLDSAALALVKHENEISEILKRLKTAQKINFLSSTT